MSAESLYSLTGNAARIANQISELAADLFSETDEPITASEEDRLTSLQVQLEQLITAELDNRQAIEAKADAWCWVVENLRAMAKARKEKADQIKKLADADSKLANRLFDELILALNRVDPEKTKWDLPNNQVVSRLSESVDVSEVEPEDLPVKYQRVKTEANKEELKKALKAGIKIKGVALVQRRSWSIK